MRHPQAQALLALIEQRGLPPTHTLTPAEARAFYRASHVCFERQIHGFITMGKVLDEANTAVALRAAELKRAFAA